MSRYINDDWLLSKIYDLVNDINDVAPSIEKDLLDDGTLSVEVEDATKVKRVLVEDGKNGDLYYTDRPQGEWEIVGKNHPYKRCPFCKRVRAFTDTRFCDWCGARMKGADDERSR